MKATDIDGDGLKNRMANELTDVFRRLETGIAALQYHLAAAKTALLRNNQVDVTRDLQKNAIAFLQNIERWNLLQDLVPYFLKGAPR